MLNTYLYLISYNILQLIILPQSVKTVRGCKLLEGKTGQYFLTFEVEKTYIGITQNTEAIIFDIISKKSKNFYMTNTQ